MAAKIPIINAKQITDSQVVVRVRAKHLQPHSSEKPEKSKNGKVDVNFFNQGFDVTIDVEEEKKKHVLWKYKAQRLPSRIEPRQCYYKVEKDEVVVTLTKKKEAGGKNTDQEYLNWIPLMHRRGLDQYDSSEDEDGNLPEPPSWKRNLPHDIDIVPGTDNLFVKQN